MHFHVLTDSLGDNRARLATFTYPSQNSRTSLLPSSYPDDPRIERYRAWHPSRRRTRKHVFMIMLFALVGAYYLLFHILRGDANFAAVVPTTVARLTKSHGAARHLHVAQRINATRTQTVTHTVHVTQTTTIRETATVTKTVSSPADPVVFVLIMISADSASEGAILIKSILMYSTSPSHFHIICDEPAQTYLEARLSLIKHPLHDIRVRFYRLTKEQIEARIAREGSIGTSHSAGAFGLLKLFIHELLPDTIKRAIYIDTDSFFISDPTLLWQTFKRLKPHIALSMPTHPDQNAAVWNFASNICSCIMLLNLERLRELRLMDSSVYREDPNGSPALSPPTFMAMYGQTGEGGHYQNVHLGDQGYFWAIIEHRPDIFEHLSYDYEVSSCLLDMYNTGLGPDDVTEVEESISQIHTWGTPHQHQAVLPKLLHFNCLDGTPRYYDWEGWSDVTNSLTKRWHAAVVYHVGAKWIWLNKGDREHGDATLEMETTLDVKFADERYAIERVQAP